MRRARVAYAGAVHEAVEADKGLRLNDGRLVTEQEVVWLPPVEPKTVFALGLNYADHAAELSFKRTEHIHWTPRPDTPSGCCDVYALRMRASCSHWKNGPQHSKR